MAVYTELKVYEECYRLFLQLVTSTARMGRDYRYTLGEQVKRASMDMLVLIFKANKAYNKAEYISLARERLVEVQILLRVFNDTRQLSDKQFAMFMEITVSVSKQLAAWERATYKGNKREGQGFVAGVSND